MMNTLSNEKHRYAVGFAAAGTVMTILFLAIVNYLTSPHYLWFVYPTFTVLWWPLSVIFARRHLRAYSFAGSILILIFLLTINLMFSPFHLWVLYAAFPILCWPAIICLGRRAGHFPAAAAVSLIGILYYSLLNMHYSPGFPWFIFPSYAFLWWPLAVLFAKRNRMMAFSLAGTCVTIVFFVVLNAVTTPHQLWAVFPIFAILWWPLTIYCFVFRKQYLKS